MKIQTLPSRPPTHARWRPANIALAGAIVALVTSGRLLAATFSTSFDSDPGGTAVGVAEIEDGILKLTDLADLPPADPAKPLPQNGSYILPDFNNGAAIQSFRAKFKAAVGGGSALGAQGFSFVLAGDLSTETPFREGGATSDNGTGVSTGLIISFDTIDNLPGFNANGNDPDDAPGIIVKVGGTKVIARSFSGLQTYPANSTAVRFTDVEVNIDPDGTLDVTYDGVKVFDDVGIGYTPIAGVFGFGAGTAELTAAIRNNHWIDDIDITATPIGAEAYVASKLPPTQQARGDAVVSIEIQSLASPDVQLTFDGSSVTPVIAGDATTRTVTYDPPGLLASGSNHKVELTYDTSKKFAFEFTVANYVTIPASAKARLGAVNTGSSGFKARVYQVASPIPSSVATAERQLAGLVGPNIADLSAAGPGGIFTIATVNWDDDQADAGQFPTDDPIPGYPGLTGDGNPALDNIVIESTAYLDLPAGLVTLGVTSDDGFKVSIGGDPRDATSPVVGIFNGVSTTQFSFAVEEAGLYGVRLLWYEGGGDAHCEFYSVQADGTRILVNDRSVAGHIKAHSEGSGDAAPYISSVKPLPDETGVNARLALDVVVTEENTVLNPESIDLTIDGTSLTPTISKSGKQTTISYQHPGTIPSATYPVTLSYADNRGNSVLSSWSFSTAPGACESVAGPSVTGYWDFADGNLNAEVGSATTYIDNSIADFYSFGTSGQGEFADIPGVNDQPMKFLSIPRNTNGEDFKKTGLRVKPGVSATPGRANGNVWTLILDLYWGEGSTAGTVLRTHDLELNSDADLFWRSDGSYGKGCCSSYESIDPAHSHQRGTWGRVVFVADLTSTPKRLAKYINGFKHREDIMGDGAVVDGRFSLPSEVFMFNDGDDNEQSSLLVSAIQFRDGALTDDEVAALGGPSPDGIPLPGGSQTGGIASHWDFNGNLQATRGDVAVFIDDSISSFYSFGTTGQGDFADIPQIDGQPAQFLSIPRNTNGEDFKKTGLRVKPGVPATAGRANANVWTLILDLYWGEGSTAGTVLRTHDLELNNDADLFWRSDGSYGKGCCSSYESIDPAHSHQRGTWGRVVFVADLTSTPKRLAKYINGFKHREDVMGDGAVLDGRFSLPSEILMFNDGDDNEQSDVLINAIQFRPVAMTDDEVAALGGPSVDGPSLTGTTADSCVPLGGSGGDLELFSADNVTGPYSTQAGATVDTGARSISVPVPSATRFYRVRGNSAVRISTVTVQGGVMVLKYE